MVLCWWVCKPYMQQGHTQFIHTQVGHTKILKNAPVPRNRRNGRTSPSFPPPPVPSPSPSSRSAARGPSGVVMACAVMLPSLCINAFTAVYLSNYHPRGQSILKQTHTYTRRHTIPRNPILPGQHVAPRRHRQAPGHHLPFPNPPSSQRRPRREGGQGEGIGPTEPLKGVDGLAEGDHRLGVVYVCEGMEVLVGGLDGRARCHTF